MNPLMLHEFHHGLNARFGELNGAEIVSDYGDWLAEHAALRETAGVIDLSFRSRICLTGADRVRFLHGQVTNDVKKLRTGEGCYAVITTAKGKMESDLNIFALADELLLDFEPGLTEKIAKRLEKFIVADDVQIVDVAAHYGLLSVQGLKAQEAVRALNLFPEIPTQQLGSIKISDATLGEIYLANNPRLDGTQGRAGSPLPAVGAHGVTRPTNFGFDLFIPNNSLGAVADKLIAAAKQIGGRACGWTAFETARIKAGIPRFGVDMDETNIPLECGIESRAIVYNKGCYIGQEVINRIHSVGHVNKELRGLHLANDLSALAVRGDKLFHAGKEVGYVTSAVKSPTLNANIALGYVRREANQIGNELTLRTAAGESPVKIAELPFVK
ncbi:MAG TPA: glycine cleavage T C-terminal barrel domain-containing protein [Verrucomicrobiae bacterium]|jgi:folate-binding protein YgfZ|nr:glycine cleavage T C-terminal barrel domain-containing protein [Verrucomicrobiae bacterium]